MNEYELADLAASSMANFLTAFTVFLSVVTAYIVAAFVAGKKLTGAQLATVNASFLIATGILGFIVGATFRRFYSIAAANTFFQPDGSPPVVDFTWALSMLMVVLVAGCLFFMFTMRRQKQADS